jgi:predicted aldo/keto reductase-like oxidoreductase
LPTANRGKEGKKESFQMIKKEKFSRRDFFKITAAALDKTELSLEDHRILEQYARKTACGYCTGCARLCESAVAGNIPISDVMRYLMYYHSYGNRRQAIKKFNKLRQISRHRLADMDYSKAESICPQKIPIARVMQSAVETFSDSHPG